MLTPAAFEKLVAFGWSAERVRATEPVPEAVPSPVSAVMPEPPEPFPFCDPWMGALICAEAEIPSAKMNAISDIVFMGYLNFKT
jgi:hypothetical protein